MDIQEYKKLARNKIEADALTKQVRDIIKITKWQKEDAREGFKETFKPLIKSQDSIKKVLMSNKTQLQHNLKKSTCSYKRATKEQTCINIRIGKN